jgi:chromosome segregation ATPase
MDDLTRRRFDRVDEKIDGLDKRVENLDKRVGNLEGRTSNVETRVEQVHGLVHDGRREAAEYAQEQRAHHAEQMRAFQEVIVEVRGVRDARVDAIETAVSELRGEVAELRARVVGPSGR